MHLIYVNRTRVNMLRLNIFLYIEAFWQHLVVILLAWLILCRHQCSCYASVNSSCAPPPQATAGHLPSLSVPGVGHLQILHCPGTGHLPTPGPLASFWHARSFLSEYKKQTGSPVKDRNKLKRIVKACSRTGTGTIDVNQRVLVIESNFCWYYLKNIFSYLYNYS